MDIEKCYGIIKNTPLFEKADRENMLQMLKTCDLCEFKTGEQIDVGQKLALIISGEAYVYSNDARRNLLLRKIHTGEIFGAAGLFCGDKPFSSIHAKGATRILFIGKDTVRQMLEQDRDFMYGYIEFLSGRVSYLNKKITYLTAGSSKRKVAVFLDSFETDNVKLPVNLSAISDVLDIGRASLYRALDEMVGDGCISRNADNISIINRDKMLSKY